MSSLRRRCRSPRAFTIDVVVRATAVRDGPQTYEYVYEVELLSSSGESLSGYSVQTFTSDLMAVAQPNLHLGRMNARGFTDGTWPRFAPLSAFVPRVVPGTTVAFRLRSAVPAALVECKADGGVVSMKGVGEEMPQELASQLLGYGA